MSMNRFALSMLLTIVAVATAAEAAPITSGQQLFLDANRASSFTTQDNTGIGGSAMDIAAWADQSGMSNNALQATALNMPELVSVGMGGLPAVRFDGIDEFLDVGALGTIGNSDFTVFAAIDLADVSGGSTGGHNKRVIHAFSGGNSLQWVVNESALDRLSSGVGNVSSTSGNVFTLLPSIVTNTGDGASTDFAFLNGVSPVSGTSAAGNPSPTGSGFRIGADRAGTGHNGQLVGDVSELVVYDRELNSAELIITENYLSSKYGITLGANDFYSGESAGSQHDVFGVGNEANSGPNPGSVTTGTSGAVTITSTGLDDGDFILAGFENDNDPTQSTIYLDETATDGNETVTLTFDLSTLGISGNPGLGYNATDPGALATLPLPGNLVGDQLSFTLGGFLQDGFFGLASSPPLAPEPSTVVLMTLALGAMAAWYSRRRRN